jgi:hypothetical protein
MGDLAAVPPQLNPLVIGGVNTIYDKVFNEDTPNELKIEFKDLSENSTNSFRGLGLLGIPIDNFGKAIGSLEAARTGAVGSTNPKYPDDKYITPDAKRVMGLAGGVQIVSQMGLLPADFNQIANRVSSDISKKSIEESKFNLFDMLNKRGKNLKNANLNIVNGKNIMESFAYSYEIKDPIIKAEYISKMKKDYGDEEYKLLKADIQESKYDMKTRDYALLVAADTEDKIALKIANCMGYKDDDTQVYTLFKEREKNNASEFYKSLTFMIKSGVVPMSTLVKYGEYIQGKMKDPNIDIQLLAKAGYEGGIKASSLDKK